MSVREMRNSRAQVAFLVYLSVCRHFVDAARAALDGAPGPEEGGSLEPVETVVSAASAPAAVASTATEPSIPRHQGKILWRNIKDKMAKKSECPVPDGQSRVKVCEWFTCKYKSHKTRLQKKVERVHVRTAQTKEDYLLFSNKFRDIYYKTFQYALLQFDRGCDPEQKMLDDLRVWTNAVFQERYECISGVVDAYLLTHENCDERFTRTFRHDLFDACKGKNFYKDDLPATARETAGTREKAGRKKGLSLVTFIAGGGPGVDGALGILLSALVPFITAIGLDFTIGTATTSGALLALGWSVFAVSLAIGAGILAASIAFLVCKYMPKKKRSGDSQSYISSHVPPNASGGTRFC